MAISPVTGNRGSEMAHSPEYRPHRVTRENRADGSVILRSGYSLSDVARTSGEWVHRWARQSPQTTFLAERDGDGWREVNYATALQKIRAIAASLLGLGLGNDTPILILSGNGVDHGLLSLAAHYVGIPTVPVAEQYSLIPGAQTQLLHIASMTRPGMVYAIDGERFATSLDLDAFDGLIKIVSRNATGGMMTFDDLLQPCAVDVDQAAQSVGPDAIVKILMTSGSTSRPKGVPTTHRMMCTNQAQILDALPFLKERPPRLIDWLPWNHVFGGSFSFNLALANGGSLFVDEGKPVKGLIDKSFENNELINGTIALNVPVGFMLLRDEMRRNARLKQSYFENLDMIFYAGSSLPQDVWKDLADMAMEVRGDVPLMCTAWGLTETAPACLFQQEPAPESGIVGVPMTGLEVKLVPDRDGRFDVRVKGPNIMRGYLDDPQKTEQAFDDEGFYCSGDAMSLVDSDDADKGLRFDGRLSEEFKLASGIWVRAASLRLEILGALVPLASDVILVGEGQKELGLLIIPSPVVAAYEDARIDGPTLTSARAQREITDRLAKVAQSAKGASNRVSRAMILSQPPSMAEGEITAKGNLNFGKLVSRRADAVERLFSDGDPALIRVRAT